MIIQVAASKIKVRKTKHIYDDDGSNKVGREDNDDHDDSLMIMTKLKRTMMSKSDES